MVFLCSAFTQLAFSPLRAAIYSFHHAIVTRMRPFDHVPYAAFDVSRSYYQSSNPIGQHFIHKVYVHM